VTVAEVTLSSVPSHKGRGCSGLEEFYMGDRASYIRNQIVSICQKLDKKGFVANHDGNVTFKDGDVIFATPTAEAKSDITAEMIIELDCDGKKISGIGKPFSEIQLHVAAYNARSDIKAVVHAHPPYATARGLLNRPLDEIGIPEAIVSIGNKIPIAEFVMPGDERNNDIIADMFSDGDIVILPGNGVLTIGDTPNQAYLRLELVEHLCKIYSIAEQTGKPMQLDEDHVDVLMKKRAKAGFKVPASYSPPISIETPSINPSEVERLVIEEVEKVLAQMK